MQIFALINLISKIISIVKLLKFICISTGDVIELIRSIMNLVRRLHEKSNSNKISKETSSEETSSKTCEESYKEKLQVIPIPLTGKELEASVEVAVQNKDTTEIEAFLLQKT